MRPHKGNYQKLKGALAIQVQPKRKGVRAKWRVIALSDFEQAVYDEVAPLATTDALKAMDILRVWAGRMFYVSKSQGAWWIDTAQNLKRDLLKYGNALCYFQLNSGDTPLEFLLPERNGGG